MGGDILDALGIKASDMIVTVAGFVVLLLILRKYFFGPIGKMLDDYQEDLRREKAEADRLREEMERQQQELTDRLEHIAAEARDKIQQATEQAHATRDEIIAQARRDAEAIIEKGRDELRREKERCLAELRDLAADLAVDGAEALLRETMTQPRQRAFVDDYLRDLERLRKN